MELKSLDLNLLVILEALLNTQSVSRAAEQLEMSQPAVSRALGRLRTMFDDPLLVRAGRSFTLSSRARRLLPSLTQQLRQLEQLVQPPEFNPESAEGLIRITGIELELALYVIPGLRRLRQLAPHIRYETVRQEEDSFPMLARDEAHFSLSGLAPMQAEGVLHRRWLDTMPVVCLMPEHHPLARTPLTIEQYAAAEHGLVSLTGRGPGMMDHMLARQGLSRQVGIRLAGFTSVPELCETAGLVFTLPQKLAEHLADGRQLVIRRLPPAIQPPDVTFYLYWHERYHRDPMLQWVREQLAAVTEPAQCGDS